MEKCYKSFDGKIYQDYYDCMDADYNCLIENKIAKRLTKQYDFLIMFTTEKEKEMFFNWYLGDTNDVEYADITPENIELHKKYFIDVGKNELRNNNSIITIIKYVDAITNKQKELEYLQNL